MLRDRITRACVALAGAVLVATACTDEGSRRADAPTPSAPETDAATTPPAQQSPAPRSERVRFAVIGDFGTGSATQYEVAEDLRKWITRNDADALVTTGDNIYPDGTSAHFEAAWHEPYGWVEAGGAEVVASLGNHDVVKDGGAAVMELLDMPHRWYAQRLGPVHLFVLDANEPEDPEQVAWLRRALKRSTAPWEVLVFHQPVYSCGIHRNTTRVMTSLLPVIQARKVDLVLNGHDHNYQRFGPRGGTAFVVTGGGGGPLYRMHECPSGTPTPVVTDTERHHFVIVSADSYVLRVRAIATDGSVIDDFFLRRVASHGG